MITELSKIDNQLAHDKKDIAGYYDVQEESLKLGMRASQLQAFPMMVSAKEANIKSLLKDKIVQEQKIIEKKQELAILRGELKVVENLKEKDYNDYRKDVNKEIDQKVEEQTQNWLQHKERKV